MWRTQKTVFHIFFMGMSVINKKLVCEISLFILYQFLCVLSERVLFNKNKYKKDFDKKTNGISGNIYYVDL